MSTWYSKHFKFEEVPNLDTLFEVMKIVPPRPDVVGYGVFSDESDAEGGQTWHISPEAHVLATALGAAPSAKPVPSFGFGLLIGVADPLKHHFPEYVASRQAGRY
jgi:hypothetical protein